MPSMPQAGLQIQADLGLIHQISGSYFKCRGGRSQIFAACCWGGSGKVSLIKGCRCGGCGCWRMLRRGVRERWIDTFLFAHLEKISKTRVLGPCYLRSMLVY